MAPAHPSRPRKDKTRSREAILDAARELFGCGREVPMYEIGRRAGVGQATLYRHFPDRAAIVATLCRDHVDQIEAVAAEHELDDHAIIAVLEASVDMLVRNHDVLGILREDAALAPVLTELRLRMLAVLETALRRSRPADLLRDDLRADDLLLLLTMINGGLVGVETREERTEAAHRALDLALNGLRRHPAGDATDG